MTENSASLGVLPRAGPTRNEPTSRGGVSTTFQAGQSLPTCASLRRDKAVIWRMSVTGKYDDVELVGLTAGNLSTGKIARLRVAGLRDWDISKSIRN